MKRDDLHAYQQHCVSFVKDHPEALLILEMGLGKTAISLTAILDLMFDRFEVGKVLIIAPLRVAKTVWPAERDSWEHTSLLKMSVIVGSAKQREAAIRTPADVYVVNRENTKWLIDYLEKLHIPWPFDMVVIYSRNASLVSALAFVLTNTLSDTTFSSGTSSTPFVPGLKVRVPADKLLCWI